MTELRKRFAEEVKELEQGRKEEFERKIAERDAVVQAEKAERKLAKKAQVQANLAEQRLLKQEKEEERRLREDAFREKLAYTNLLTDMQKGWLLEESVEWIDPEDLEEEIIYALENPEVFAVDN
ncbi:hypothetical protein CYMTET_11982 [Cymbomonas tetramitiformis]|uniref:Uncharacterized protein n=1 Tax=Cymbomonas tetramitiformis TaxID=36881 RepID=A0AAE0GKZ3_9CHLO|nr:hypothetical protein CYMTET_11982 [Cymbomonas tetramitiformis]